MMGIRKPDELMLPLHLGPKGERLVSVCRRDDSLLFVFRTRDAHERGTQGGEALVDKEGLGYALGRKRDAASDTSVP